MRRIERALLSMVTLAAAHGCAFVYDYPELGELGGGGSAAGGGGGGSGGAAPGPHLLAVIYDGKPNPDSEDEVVAITGLDRDEPNDQLYAFGNTTYGLQGPPLPLGLGPQVFLLDFVEGVPHVAMSANACGGFDRPITRRMNRWYNDAEFFLSGSLPTQPLAITTWGFALGAEDGCRGESVIDITPTDDASATHVPFGAIYSGNDISVAGYNDSDGLLFETEYRDPVLAFFGAASGNVLEQPNTQSSYFIFMQDDSLGESQMASHVFDTIPADLFTPGGPQSSWVGGIEIDTVKTAWFTGAACDIGSGCEEPELFLGTFAIPDAAPTLLVKDPGVPSAGTSVELVDGLILIGGRYQGELNLLSEVFPASSWAVPFVAAVESSTKDVVWSYPADEDAASFDPARWKMVVDMAVVGNRETGSVWVAGCSAPPTAEVLDCATFEPGKSGFLIELSLATGRPEWTKAIELEDPSADAFVPTAIFANDEAVWLAASHRGTVDAFGQSLTTGPWWSSAILQFAP